MGIDWLYVLYAVLVRGREDEGGLKMETTDSGRTGGVERGRDWWKVK